MHSGVVAYIMWVVSVCLFIDDRFLKPLGYLHIQCLSKDYESSSYMKVIG